VIPNSVTHIGENAFGGCTALESAYIGTGVVEICDEIFFDCKNLSTVTYLGTVDAWNKVKRDYFWLYGTKIDKIICSDGIGDASGTMMIG